MKRYSSLVLFIMIGLFLMLVSGCSKNTSPTQVVEQIKFGKYKVSPPSGYWYFPRSFPKKFTKDDDSFLLTFFEKKELISNSESAKDGIFINLIVSNNKYKSKSDYYDEMSKYGAKYSNLPEDGKNSNDKDWTCKQVIHGLYGIECFSQNKEHFIIIGMFGERKKVNKEVHLLYDMLESFEEGPD